MEEANRMKQDREPMKAAFERAKQALADRRAKGEIISDEGDFIAREIQQFFLDLDASNRVGG